MEVSFETKKIKLQMTKYRANVKAILPGEILPLVTEIYYKFRSLFYTGNRVYCPCCDRQFRKFISFTNLGGNLRENAICPRCSSHERHRLLWLFLKNKTNLFDRNIKLLHFAPEYYFWLKFSTSPNLDYHSADLSSSLASSKMDITNILYEDNCFDAILCNHVLEHIMDDRKAMSELFRVLKPGGWAILQVPLDRQREKTFEDPQIVSPEEREKLFGQYDHVRMYGRDYKDRLEAVGFTVKVDDYVKEIEPDLIKRAGLDRNEDIYFCTKPQLK
ncbi:MAG: methyltransferase domain-containing protein [Oscillatoria princeps RMCB-10]|jgi:predicted SAM-dependent methyltransferase|nr:methyltransferase domain-containing protein [Oscillatoria princeps RMCB-10]